MFGLFLRAFAITIIGLMLTACGTRPKPMPEVQQIYEIRAVAVTANAGISRTIMRGIKQRLDKSTEDTVRPIPMPRAVMNIHIVGVTRIQGLDGLRTETELSVALTDVASGQALLVRSFLVYSFSINERDANESAAEAVAARLRVEYALSQPVIRMPQARAPRLATQMTGEADPVLAKQDRPVVIPLKTAPAIGADEDPVLNSRTKVAPETKDEASLPEKKSVIPAVRPKAADTATVDNSVEAGANAKVVIKPKAAEPVADEPCVETMDKKC